MKSLTKIQKRIDELREKSNQAGKTSGNRFKRCANILSQTIDKPEKEIDSMIPATKIERDKLTTTGGKAVYNWMIHELNWVLENE